MTEEGHEKDYTKFLSTELMYTTSIQWHKNSQCSQPTKLIYIIGISLKHLCTFISFKMKNGVLCAIYLYLWFTPFKKIYRSSYFVVNFGNLLFRVLKNRRNIIKNLIKTEIRYLIVYIWYSGAHKTVKKAQVLNNK